jgi:hypothetical protein
LKRQIKRKTSCEKFKINHQENRNKLFLEIECKIKELDNNEKELFFNEQISFLNKEIEEISNSTNQNDKELLKELRQKLHVTYIVRKQNGFQKVNNKFNEKLEEEWLSWLKKNGKA